MSLSSCIHHLGSPALSPRLSAATLLLIVGRYVSAVMLFKKPGAR